MRGNIVHLSRHEKLSENKKRDDAMRKKSKSML